MRRLPPLLALALATASCSLLVVPTTTVPVAPPTPPPVSTSTPTVTTSEPAPRPSVDCTPEPGLELVCEALSLITERYVDAIPLDTLTAAAARGVEEFAGSGADTDPVTCPAAQLQAMCDAIDTQDVEPVTAAQAAVTGMVAFALDPNSAYLDPQALALTIEDQSGQVEGIGALVTTEDLTADDPTTTTCPVVSDTCRLVIVSTLAGTPADQAGLTESDEIDVVDGTSTIGMTIDEVTSLVRGPAGTDVHLGIVRDGGRFDVTITRAAIQIDIAEWQMVGDTGYLRLNVFSDNADEEVDRGLAELIASGAKRIVFDLRDDPGGALSSAVNIASEFLPDGLVLKTESPDAETTYPVVAGGRATTMPVVVLINRGSASASEVVTGALQEAGRAVVVGETSFGKNTVQQRFDLSNGGALKITIARWVTPAGTDLDNGITPDVEADLPRDLTVPDLVDKVLLLTAPRA